MLGEKYKPVNFGVKTSGTKLERPDQSETDLVERLLNRNVEQFRGGLVFKAHRLVYHSTRSSREVKKKKKTDLDFLALSYLISSHNESAHPLDFWGSSR